MSALNSGVLVVEKSGERHVVIRTRAFKSDTIIDVYSEERIILSSNRKIELSINDYVTIAEAIKEALNILSS